MNSLFELADERGLLDETLKVSLFFKSFFLQTYFDSQIIISKDFDSFGAMNVLYELQDHENEDVYLQALEMTEKYFKDVSNEKLILSTIRVNSFKYVLKINQKILFNRMVKTMLHQ